MNIPPHLQSRRRFLGNIQTGLMGIALSDLLQGDAKATSSSTVAQWLPGRGSCHHHPKAKRVLQIFCPGAASHMDLWEHKPELDKWHGKPLPGEENLVSFQGKNGNLMKSPWPFIKQGQSGKAISSMLPHLGQHVDDIAFIHSMHSDTNTHGPGCVFMNTGQPTEGFPVPEPGSVTPSAAPIKIYRLTSASPISVVSRLTAKPTGATAFYPPSIRPS